MSKGRLKKLLIMRNTEVNFMENNNYKNSMVLYESAYLAINYLPDDKMKWEAMEGLLKYGFYGEIPESKNPFINMVYVQAIPSMRNAKQRYEKAVDDGKRGGRPATIDRDTVYKLKEQGMTHQQIADRLGCSKEAIKKIFQREGTKGTNLSVSVSVSDSVSSSVSDIGASPKEEDFANAQESSLRSKTQKKRTIQDLSYTEGDEIVELINNNKSTYIDIQKKYNLEYGSVTINFPAQWQSEKNARAYSQEIKQELKRIKNEPKIDYEALVKQADAARKEEEEEDISQIMEEIFVHDKPTDDNDCESEAYRIINSHSQDDDDLDCWGV